MIMRQQKLLEDYFSQSEQVLPSELAFDEAPQDVVNKVFNITLRTIMEGQSIVNVDEIHRAARFFYQARQRDLYGAGGSNAICADVQHKFLRIGVRCQAYPDAHIMMMSASLLQEGDVVLVVTHSGRTSDVNELKTPKIDEIRLPDLFYRVTSGSAIALKTLTIQQYLSSNKPEKQITSCF
jgi:DNA-binding MurR/RpiR family transcriptional regulator